MIAPMAKVQLAVLRRDKDAFLQFLQEEEILHVIEEETPGHAVGTDTAYQLAQVQFGLEFIERLRRRVSQYPKRSFRTMFSPKPIATVGELETQLAAVHGSQVLEHVQTASDKLLAHDNTLAGVEEHIAALTPWQALDIQREHTALHVPVDHALLKITTHDETRIHEELSALRTGVWQEVLRRQEGNVLTIYGELVMHRQHRRQLEIFLQQPGVVRITLNLTSNATIADRLADLRQQQRATQQQIDALLADAQNFFAHEPDLKFAYDALLHREEREGLEQRLVYFERSVLLTGWMPRAWLIQFTERTARLFPDSAIAEIEPTDNDVPPVALMNRRALRPFEAVTNIYGKPAYHELDPTPALSIFFLIAFGFALTDAGYGLVMMAGTWAAQKFFRLKRDTRNMVQLLFYGGAATVVLGALTGGWFGITLETLPAGAIRDGLLGIKILDPVSQPMVLLVIALALGVLQLLTAWGVRGYYNWTRGKRQNVFLDDIPWITMVIFLLIWAASSRTSLVPVAQEPLWRWVAIANAIFLIATQGRQHKNPLLKLGSGTLSLYGLVGFLSDTLSYSRLLALGLATGIIGLVVNLIATLAADAIPVVGVVLAAGVLLIGHTFNLGINTLGAFIHSGRLQFVEFFPKFMEGGGVAFSPFGRVSRYIDNPREFA